MNQTHQTVFQARREKLWSALEETRAHAFVVTALPNARYLSGFSGSNAAMLITGERSLLFTDPRYDIQAHQETDCEVKVAKGPLLKHVCTWIKRLRLTRVAFEGNRISFQDYEQLKEWTNRTRLTRADGMIESLRMVKSVDEIATIKASVQLNSAAFEQTIRHFKPSMTEVDIAAELEYRMRRMGADCPAFETIVASGAKSALPHARASDCPILRDELLLMDMGASVAGYVSDMTRTYAVGRLDTKRRRMHRAVLESQLAAVDAVKPGITCATVDRAARDVLRDFGMEKLFIHSTGHGLGLEIHERPRLGRKERTKLEAGMVITIEPGVYEESFGGVRIEDTVVVTPGGCQILTPTGKELVVL